MESDEVRSSTGKYRYRIDVAIFGQYRIDIVSKLKSWCRVITSTDLCEIASLSRTKCAWNPMPDVVIRNFPCVTVFKMLTENLRNTFSKCGNCCIRRTSKCHFFKSCGVVRLSVAGGSCVEWADERRTAVPPSWVPKINLAHFKRQGHLWRKNDIIFSRIIDFYDTVNWDVAYTHNVKFLLPSGDYTRLLAEQRGLNVEQGRLRFQQGWPKPEHGLSK